MALWTPADVADDLALWLDFADEPSVTLVSGKISEITDKGAGLSVGQSTAGNRPEYVSGEHSTHKVARFDQAALTRLIINGYTTTARNTTLFIVAKIPVSPPVSFDHTGMFLFNNSSFGGAYPWTDGLIYEAYGTTARQDSITPTSSLADWNLYQVKAASGTNGWRASLNANTLRTATVTLANFLTACELGRSSARYFKGCIAEVIVLEGVDTETTENIQGYLAHKWGTAAKLPADHPFKEFPPGYEPPSNDSVVSGVVMIDGQPASRRVRAFSYNSVVHTTRGDEVTESLTLGKAMSDPDDGSYTINLHQGYTGPVFVVTFDDLGQAFTPSAELTLGDRVRPSTFAGYVFECDGAGTLPADEPDWNNDLENSHVYGTASLRAKPFYRPQVHGPITPLVAEEEEEDP